MKKCIIITTINPPTKAVREFIKMPGWDVIIVGDVKTPDDYHDLNCIYLDIATQNRLYPTLSNLLPKNHYCRKNIGYIYAIESKYDIIYETDDDNIPYEPTWNQFEIKHHLGDADKVISAPKFPNIYSLYTTPFDHIWARGFPLHLINKAQPIISTTASTLDIGNNNNGDNKSKSEVFIWQGLANGDPDVDAIYRLTTQNNLSDFKFSDNGRHILEREVYTPFNSQNTYWINRKAFPYLYIPSTTTFRYCDILRSFIAQWGIWQEGGLLGITEASVYQERNAHDYMVDFISEVPMYQHSKKVFELLDMAKCDDANTESRLEYIYGKLSEIDVVQSRELDIIREWNRLLQINL